MKNSFVVLLFAAINCGCATPTAPQVDSRTLISYSEIAAEITVSHQAASGPGEIPQPVAVNLPD